MFFGKYFQLVELRINELGLLCENLEKLKGFAEAAYRSGFSVNEFIDSSKSYGLLRAEKCEA